MPAREKSGTAAMHGRFWGHRSRDWAELQEGMARPAYETVLQRTGVGAGTRYLDVGCGAGLSARLAADRGAQVSGIDAAEPMLAVARLRTPSGDFRHGDLQRLPFGDAAFDVVAGFNAFQFADEPAAALAEAARVTGRGGVIAVMVWGPPEGMPAVSLVTALRPLLPPAPPGAPGPFALSGEAALRKLATAAGLRPDQVFDVECPFLYPDLETAVRALNSSGVAGRAMQHAGEQAVSDAHRAALAPFRQADGSYRAGATFRCLLARPSS